MSEIELVDLDSVEIVTAIEQAFHIKIADKEAEGCRTVGDLFRLIASKLPIVERDALPCPTAFCYRRLRAVLRKISPIQHITPATQLVELMPVSRSRAWWRRVQIETNLALPQAPGRLKRFRWVIGGVCVLAMAVALVSGAGAWSLLVGLAALLVSLVVHASDRRDVIGMGIGATVGDLAKITAALNAGLLVEQHGAIRTREVWSAVEGVIRAFTAYSGPIDKRTRFRCT